MHSVHRKQGVTYNTIISHYATNATLNNKPLSNSRRMHYGIHLVIYFPVIQLTARLAPSPEFLLQHH